MMPSVSMELSFGESMVGALGFTVSTVMFTGLEAFEVPAAFVALAV
jgi:hypothetical protein